MRNGIRRRRALPRPAWALAALGVLLSGCGLSDYPYGHSGGYSYSSPSYYRSHHHRSDSSSRPRSENWSQQRLQQHWVSQAQRAR